MEREILIAIGLLLYGILHGVAVVYVSRTAPKALPLIRLLTSCIGIGITLLAAVPFIGWQSAGIVFALLAISAAPVLFILGYDAVQVQRSDGL